MIAVVFPGQGSQKIGMARDFYAEFSVSRRTFEEASDAITEDLRAICFHEDPRLGLTEYTQPAILTAEIAMFRALHEELGLAPDRLGGHSLGEYTALVAAGVIPLAEAVQLVRERGRRMQEAVPVGQGAMTAVIAAQIDVPAVQAVLDGLVVDIANHNSPEQIVLSGRSTDIDEAEDRIRAVVPGVRLRRLTVSAPFHSRLMRPIEDGFRILLEGSATTWSADGIGTVVSNYTGGFYPDRDTAALVDGLTCQLSGAVRWVDNMTVLASGADRIIEVGPKRPLRGFFRIMGVSVDAITNLTMARRALG
jgi:[acyl-carrier-protein] S-malonyltransferase/trans-AT polyketide synthase/acyltransferase/oxidoreductase domain-containing protein